MLAEATRARAAGAEVVIASVHCCTESQPDPSPAQTAIAAALLASPDVDLVLGHHPTRCSGSSRCTASG
jgi:poly-gamma-glutamate capsule biosynthesis protein CapA/YwtB (metallophosphatase superfamily)